MQIELPALDRFPQHRRLLERAVAHFQPDERVLALAVSGSIATGNMDFYSDIDLGVIVRDADFDAVFAERDQAAEALGAPLTRFIADHMSFGAHLYIVLYEGPLKVDCNYRHAAEVAPSLTWTSRVVLKDTNGFLAGVKSQSSNLKPDQPPRDKMLVLDQKFWAWCWYSFGKIARGELWEAIDAIDGIRGLALLPMLSWLTGTPDVGSRRLESKLDANAAAKWSATIATRHPDSLHAALQAEIVLFTEMREKLFTRFNLKPNSAAEQYVTEALRHYWTARDQNRPS